MRARLSTLWIFVVLNYLYCDVVSLMDHELLRLYLDGRVGGLELSQGFLFGAGVLMEVSIAMVLLARLLPPSPNRIANVAAGVITTLVQLGALVSSPPTAYFAFFSVIEIVTTAYIAWAAWRWRAVPHVASAVPHVASAVPHVAPAAGQSSPSCGSRRPA